MKRLDPLILEEEEDLSLTYYELGLRDKVFI